MSEGQSSPMPRVERPALRVTIVTDDRVVYDGLADRVSAPATLGMITVLPRHVCLITTLEPGELVVKWEGEAKYYAISGGFLEVRDDEVTILGDTVERAEEIDVARAEAARQRAEALVHTARGRPEYLAGLQALRRSRARLKVAQRVRR
ncbi:MAG: ATP synthase F1 subunit epsilon [Chloroflexi bacterium]|nr:ATP synthase F1 subunit epsilon [Chloroflexota bacterium]